MEKFLPLSISEKKYIKESSDVFIEVIDELSKVDSVNSTHVFYEILLTIQYDDILQGQLNEVLNNTKNTNGYELYRYIKKNYCFGESNIDYKISEMDKLPNKIVYEQILKLQRVFNFKYVNQLLPHILEAFEYRILNNKKALGIYYTPDDVIQNMVETTFLNLKLSEISNEKLISLKIIDPAMGTGVFLREALNCLNEEYKKRNLNVSKLDIINNNLFGIDKSNNAVEATNYILLGECLSKSNNNPSRILHQIKRKTLVANTLSCSFSSLENILISKWDEIKINGFNMIIGNPPYYKLDKINNEYISTKQINRDSNIYLFFVEILMKWANTELFSGGLVIPLSISYTEGTTTKSIRELISKDSQNWKFEFYDRSPDSLFGDDVKTRNCIIYRYPLYSNMREIKTTSLKRWNSRNRNALFTNNTSVDIHELPIQECIPKISNNLEKEVYKILSSLNNDLEKVNVQKLNQNAEESLLFFYSTAYNWIPVFLEIPPSYDNGEKFIPKSLWAVRCEDYEHKIILYAILSSRLVYWYWNIISDGFHFSKKNIQNFFLNTNQIENIFKNKLYTLGEELWFMMQENYVSKQNAGKLIGNYSPINLNELLDKIDEVVIELFRLPKSFKSFLSEWYYRKISAGRLEFKYSNVFASSEEQMEDIKDFISKINIDADIKEKSKLSKDEWREWTKTVWSIANISSKDHPAVFPEEIPYRLIRMCSFYGETVLDPFNGTGTTGVAALSCGRKYIGFDTNSDYINVSKNRLEEFNFEKIEKDYILVNESCIGESMKGIPDNSIGTIVTSPPYWDKANYGEIEGNIGNFEKYDEFLENIAKVIAESYRILMPGRRMSIVTANVNQKTTQGLLTFPIAADLIKIAQNEGFYLVNELIWNKDGTGGKWGSSGKQRPIFGSYPHPPNFLFKNVHEYIIILRKPDVKKTSNAPEYNDLFLNEPHTLIK